jgi:hypothetical protein
MRSYDMGGSSTTISEQDDNVPPFPGFDHLYRVSDPVNPTSYRGSPRFPEGYPGGAHTRGERTPVSPVTVAWSTGRSFPDDIVWTTYGLDVIISDKVKHILEQGLFSGWNTYPVTVMGKDGRDVGRYHGLAVTGRCGRLDDSVGNWIWKKGRVYRQGYYFDPSSWDGSDVFTSRAQSSATVFVVRAVADVLRTAKIGNIELEAMSEVLRPAIDGEVNFAESGPPPGRP